MTHGNIHLSAPPLPLTSHPYDVWIGDWNKFNDVLRDARYGYNHRSNSAFGYKNPLEVMAAKISNLPQQVCGH
jgi:hypothetical protein